MSSKQRYDCMIIFKATTEIKDYLAAKAKEENVSVAEILRKILIAAIREGAK